MLTSPTILQRLSVVYVLGVPLWATTTNNQRLSSQRWRLSRLPQPTLLMLQTSYKKLNSNCKKCRHFKLTLRLSSMSRWPRRMHLPLMQQPLVRRWTRLPDLSTLSVTTESDGRRLQEPSTNRRLNSSEMLPKLVRSSAIVDHSTLSSETNLLLITSRTTWRRREFRPSKNSYLPNSLSLNHKWVIGRWKVFHRTTCLSRMQLW